MTQAILTLRSPAVPKIRTADHGEPALEAARSVGLPIWLGMSAEKTADGRLAWGEPVSPAGSYALFRAEMDLVIAFSACPQDILPINGRTGRTTDAHFAVE